MTFRQILVLSQACLVVSFSIKTTPSKGAPTLCFWDDARAVTSLPDPPSAERLKIIQESPYRGGFEPARDSIEPYSPKIMEGSIPPSLHGSLSNNGPGRIRLGETQYGHWFDGDGYVTLLSFHEGKATFRAKYVRTERFKAQEQLMTKLQGSEVSPPLAWSGAWTSAGKGRWYENMLRIPTNPSNTATMWISSNEQPRLYCLCEGGDPVELDPSTLDTISPETPFHDADDNKKVDSFFSAHFSRDAESGDIYNHGYILNPGPGPSRLNVIRLGSDGTLLDQRQCELPFDTFVHDSTLSQHYLVYFLPPYHNPPSSMYKFLLGLSPIGKLFEWNPTSLDAYVHVHSNQNLELLYRIKLPNPATTLYHLVDAHDEVNEADGTILLQVRVAEHVPPDRVGIEEQFADQYQVKDGTRFYTNLREYTFALNSRNGNVQRVSDTDVCKDAAPCEFPAINTQWNRGRLRYCWTNALSSPSQNYLDGIQKVDMKQKTASPVVTFGDECFAGPPAFIPKENAVAEDDGYIMTTVYRALQHTSDVVILNAATLEIVCRMELTDHVPYQFHGDFIAGFVPRP